MGLFKSIKRQLLKVIEWKDNATTTIVYKYPMTDRDEIMNGCQLIVRESQVAILVLNGQIGDVYGPGLHKLETQNMPIITKLASWKYGFDSPFKCDVFYVNTKQFFDLKWGTATPIMIRDAEFGPVRIRARGTYSFRISDAAVFMREIFGTNKEYSTESLREYFKSMVVSSFADGIGELRIPVLDLAANYREIGEQLKSTLNEDFDNLGVEICNMVVEAITLPEEVEKVLDQRSSVGIMSDKMASFTQFQSAQAIRDAAKNEGGGLAGMGVGMGAGVGLGQAFANSINTVKDEPRKAPGASCPECHAEVPTGAKFCPGCGKAVQQDRFCSECGTKVKSTAKFCSNCGNKME